MQGGHSIEVLAMVTYASVVSCETVCVALSITLSNVLNIMARDILNAYISVPNEEKILMSLGPEFVHENGCKKIVFQALYCLKLAGLAYLEHMYQSSKADLTHGSKYAQASLQEVEISTFVHISLCRWHTLNE